MTSSNRDGVDLTVGDPVEHLDTKLRGIMRGWELDNGNAIVELYPFTAKLLGCETNQYLCEPHSHFRKIRSHELPEKIEA